MAKDVVCGMNVDEKAATFVEDLAKNAGVKAAHLIVEGNVLLLQRDGPGQVS